MSYVVLNIRVCSPDGFESSGLNRIEAIRWIKVD